MLTDQSVRRAPDQRRLISVALTLGIVISCVFVLSKAKHIFIPLVMAVLAVYLIDIVARLIRKIRFGRHQVPITVSLVLAFFLIFGVSFALVDIIIQNAFHVAAVAPKYQSRLSQLQTEIFARAGIEEPRELRQLLRTIDFRSAAMSVARAGAAILEDVVLVAIYGIFIMLERRFFAKKLNAIFPDFSQKSNALVLLRRIDHDIHTYLGVKTAVSFTTGVLAYILMRSVGLDFAEFWALLIFLLHFIPTIGVILAAIFPSVLAAVQFDSLGPFLAVSIGITAIAQFMGSIVEPNLVGESLNLSPLGVIVALIVWGSLWGIVGAFLCVPLTVIMVIVMANFQTTRWVAVLLSKTGEIRPLK